MLLPEVGTDARLTGVHAHQAASRGFFTPNKKAPMKVTPLDATSYAGGIVSIGSAVTLTQWGVIAGILTALLTLLLNVWYTRQKNAREQRLADQQAHLADLAEREAKARLAALGVKL